MKKNINGSYACWIHRKEVGMRTQLYLIFLGLVAIAKDGSFDNPPYFAFYMLFVIFFTMDIIELYKRLK